MKILIWGKKTEFYAESKCKKGKWAKNNVLKKNISKNHCKKCKIP
jgi:hypothetical protein